MENTKYNGWANWETWNCYNWLSSDYGSTKELEKQAKNMSIAEFKNYWNERFENQDGIETGKINFVEIKNAFIDI
jgi:hypothetical protein